VWGAEAIIGAEMQVSAINDALLDVSVVGGLGYSGHGFFTRLEQVTCRKFYSNSCDSVSAFLVSLKVSVISDTGGPKSSTFCNNANPNQYSNSATFSKQLNITAQGFFFY
jgi:hypothetical protein